MRKIRALGLMVIMIYLTAGIFRLSPFSRVALAAAQETAASPDLAVAPQYGREMTGYEVSDLDGTPEKAKTAGVQILVRPYTSDHRDEAIVQFPGGYIAEIYSATKPNTSH